MLSINREPVVAVGATVRVEQGHNRGCGQVPAQVRECNRRLQVQSRIYRANNCDCV